MLITFMNEIDIFWFRYEENKRDIGINAGK